MRVEERIDIARPPHDVWAFVADPFNDPRWCRKKMPKALRPILGYGVKRDLVGQLRDLKRVLESA